MKKIISGLALLLVASSCGRTQSHSNISPGINKPGPQEAVATFSEGCFWHAEIIFQSLKGVRDAVSGYAGGNDNNPSYEKVASGQTGHAESVQVYYDPAVISFSTLVDAFFASHDPTTLNRQGNDRGTEYRSIAFYRNPSEKRIIDNAIKKIESAKLFKDKVVTEVKEFKDFYPAEAYHQEYILNHPGNPYVQHVSIPEYERFRKTFKGNFRN